MYKNIPASAPKKYSSESSSDDFKPIPRKTPEQANKKRKYFYAFRISTRRI